MPEMPHAGEHHRQSLLVAALDRVPDQLRQARSFLGGFDLEGFDGFFRQADVGRRILHGIMIP